MERVAPGLYDPTFISSFVQPPAALNNKSKDKVLSTETGHFMCGGSLTQELHSEEGS